MHRLATVKPVTVALGAGSRIDDAGHVKRHLRGGIASFNGFT
jgi:hypothetical protein